MYYNNKSMKVKSKGGLKYGYLFSIYRIDRRAVLVYAISEYINYYKKVYESHLYEHPPVYDRRSTEVLDLWRRMIWDS